MSDEPDFGTIPLLDRLNHKSWKARLNAYEEMKTQFSNSANDRDECFCPFLDDPTIYQKIVADSNVAAQEAGISSLVLFLEFGGPQASIKLRSVVVQPLAEKGLASMRAGTKQASLEAILRFIELDTPEPILEGLFPLLSHKVPKLVAATTLAYCEIFKNFGAKIASPRIIIKTIPKLFGHPDKNVRAEASALTIELYRWLGDGIKSAILPDLKPVQQKELEEQFIKVVGENPEQKRLLRHQKEELALAELNSKSGANGGSEQPGSLESKTELQADPFEFVEPVNVLSKIPDNFYSLSRSTKWKERKEALEALYTAVNTPKIQDGDFHELAATLAKCMKDANVQVVTLAANSLEFLAGGLKSQFAPYKAIVLGPTLERLKEKKPSIADALNNALDAIYLSASFSDCLDDILEYLAHKTPQVKIGTANFLIRCLKTVRVVPKKSETSAINEVCLKLVGDTQEPVRAAGQEALGIMMKIIGEREMKSILDGLEDLRKNKIYEFYEKAEVVAKPEKPMAQPPIGRSTGNIASNKRPAVNALPNSRRAVRPIITTPKKLGPGSILGESPRPMAARAATPGSIDNSESTIPAPSNNGRLSPTRRATSPFKEESAVSTPSLGGRPSLMNNRLAQRLATPTTQVTRADASLSAVEKAELVALRAEVETLRAEKTLHQKTMSEFESRVNQNQIDTARLLREIDDLQVKNSQLVDDHTRDVLALKSRETQLTRASSDLDSANQKISKLRNDLERLTTKL
ncbi:ARM repeat-containing protein, partial [Nadsonia fulvescens var. elongata DSM 6958]